MPFLDVRSEVEDLLKKRGISTFALIIRDPDSDIVASQFEGNESTIYLECELICERIRKTRVEAWGQNL